MAVHMNVDARDWIRGTRPWEQFLVYCNRLGREQGSELWATYLTDRRLFDMYRELLDQEDEDAEKRPGLFGYDRTAEGLHAVQVQLALLYRVMAQTPTFPLPKGPVFPGEVLRSESDEAEVVDLFTEIAAAQQRWREEHESEVS